ncbi:MAG: hypothetical protein EU533_07520 [Promethearchaeota archaeon]|nr:MAG: hypothetical protein EU533_07520 [Candidatus Lokiarchaeota archaeon]
MKFFRYLMRNRSMGNIISLKNYYLNNKNDIISISGPSGSGKTTLALQLFSSLIQLDMEEKCIWVEASEPFPKKRLEALLSGNLTRKTYVLKNTFIFPSDHVITSFKEQLDLLVSLSSRAYPPGIKYFVVDNISHHLRLYLSLQRNITQRSKEINRFFDEALFPLIMRFKRENIIFIMIHEISQDPNTGVNHPFFHKLFNRVQAIHFSFQGSLRLGTHILNIIPHTEQSFQVSYELKNEGIFICHL